MAPFYEEVCRDLGWKVEEKLLATMKAANEEKLKQLDEAIEDAEKNLGETEIRDAMLSKAEHLSRIGDKVRDGLQSFKAKLELSWEEFSVEHEDAVDNKALPLGSANHWFIPQVNFKLKERSVALGVGS